MDPNSDARWESVQDCRSSLTETATPAKDCCDTWARFGRSSRPDAFTLLFSMLPIVRFCPWCGAPKGSHEKSDRGKNNKC